MEDWGNEDRMFENVNRILTYVDNEYENDYSTGVSVLLTAFAQYIIERSEPENISKNLEMSISSLRVYLSEIRK